MPGKTAKSAPLPPFGLSGMTALVRAATLSCENAGKSQKCTQDRESVNTVLPMKSTVIVEPEDHR